MKFIKALAPILIICILSAGGYWYWTTTPPYSIMKLGEAVHNHDLTTFQQYFDINGVSSNAVNDLTAEAISEADGPRLLQRLLGVTIMGALKTQTTELLAKNISDYVEKPTAGEAQNNSNIQKEGGLDLEKTDSPLEKTVKSFVKKVVEAIKPPSLREVLSTTGLTKKNFRGTTAFETSGQVCQVGLLFQPPGQENIKVGLELENRDNHWHVIRISNLGALARILTASPPP